MGELPIPAHVPPTLVRDFDYLREVEGEELWHWWSHLHDGPEIFYTPHNGGHWVLTRHAAIAEVLADYTRFSSRHQTVPVAGKPFSLPPIEVDPPLHGEFRRLIAPWFTPKAMVGMESDAKALCIELIEGFRERGHCEFISEFALVMPIGIFLKLVDLPAGDRLHLLEIAEKMVRGDEEQQAEGFAAAFEYLDVKLEERRRNPGDDMLSAIVTGTIDGGRLLTDEEARLMGALLLAGGLDTVAGMIGFITQHLAGHDEHRRLLASEPDRIHSATEELMRRHQIANIAREVVADTEYHGVAMKAGDMILTPTSMAAVDDREYNNPLEVDFDRPNKRSIVFGNGPHQCIGAFLARTEIRVFLREWLARIPEFRIAAGKTSRVFSGRANAMRYLPLEWDIR
ncbi:cytochrome P450 [Croceicoccus mobilis]|uniref:Cytochrome P450 n=2 Tax=Croceicoccus mobilis TaxID=1703339 RepID=A0A917DYT1_9SPHN|nr:cytochrome P450 [Croceicoccus mobilis]